MRENGKERKEALIISKRENKAAIEK